MHKNLKTFGAARDGATAIITAASAMAIMGFAGLAVDVGSVYLESRRLQGTADLAALAAMQDPGNAQALAMLTVRANDGSDAAQATTTLGTYTPSRDLPVAQRFQPGDGASAVRVDLTGYAPLYFARLFVPDGQMRIVRHATAAQTRLASFQIGSRLLSLQGGVANAVLSALTGSQVTLTAMDYNALLNTDVDLLSYVDALHTRLNLQGASFDQTLSGNVQTSDALAALADTLRASDVRAAEAVGRVAAAATHAAPVNLHNLIDLGAYGAQDHATLSGQTAIHVNAMDLATAILEIAGGDRQVRLDLGAGVPGLASTDVWLAIGERPNNSPWIAVTDSDSVIIRTAQTRLYVETNVRPAVIGAIASVRVPVLVELAAAQAKLQDVTCGASPSSDAVTLSVAPSIGSLSLGEVNTSRLDDFKSALTPSATQLVNLTLIRVTGSAHVDVGGAQWQSVRFSGSDIENGRVKTVATNDAARATVSTLLANTHLTVNVAGLGLNATGVTSTVSGALGAAAAPLDDLINGLTDLLGLRLGEADVRVNGVRCGGAALVA
jgi:uncharacterized membrane protein